MRSPFGGAALILRRKHQQHIKRALDRPLKGDEEMQFIAPVRMSWECLLAGKAEIADLHNIVAFLNTGNVLAADVGEHEAGSAIEAGIVAIHAIKSRGGKTFAMNAAQRETAQAAVDLTDELFCCCTLFEITTAYHKWFNAIPQNGTLEPIHVEV